MRCSFCEGVWHPATGHAYSETFRACYSCTVTFWRWVVRHTARRWGKVYFYECATKGQERP